MKLINFTHERRHYMCAFKNLVQENVISLVLTRDKTILYNINGGNIHLTN